MHIFTNDNSIYTVDKKIGKFEPKTFSRYGVGTFNKTKNCWITLFEDQKVVVFCPLPPFELSALCCYPTPFNSKFWSFCNHCHIKNHTIWSIHQIFTYFHHSWSFFSMTKHGVSFHFQNNKIRRYMLLKISLHLNHLDHRTTFQLVCLACWITETSMKHCNIYIKNRLALLFNTVQKQLQKSLDSPISCTI